MSEHARTHSGTRSSGADSYWSLARSPLHCLIFLLPLLTIYEVGVLWLGGSRATFLRNGADYWMRDWLLQQGWNAQWLLPVLVIAALLAWQVLGRYPWKIRFDTLIGMGAESLLFACVLLLLGQTQDILFQQYLNPPQLAVSPTVAWGSPTARMVSFVGAGIYEEVLFRLLALPLAFVALRILLVPDRLATVLAVVGTSLLFSLAHYIGPGADTFTYFSFVFRTVAGLFFAVLFVLRGFGITVGAHAVYDVLVGVLLRP
ncbi:MAG: amino terminal protease self-immunity [Planctomycetaceae bacterium]|nr:amino terminal protease self-immunity [Planctomycetaceae bacterium]